MLRLVPLVVACALIACVTADEVNEKDVLVLTPDNFDSTLKEHPQVLVEFYAPWCGHCKKLKPEYASAATKLRQKGSTVRLAKVDADAHKSLGTQYDIQGFPTLKWFNNGKVIEFQGGRTADEIVQWVLKKMGPPAVAIADAAALDKFTTDNKFAIVGFFDASADSKAFLDVAGADDSTEYGIVTDEALISAQGAKSPAIFAFRPEIAPHQTRKVQFTGAMSEEEITKFASTYSMDLVTEFSPESQPKIFGSHIKEQVILFSDAAKADTKTLKTTFLAAAADNVGKAIFVTVGGDNNGILEYFGLKKAQLPAVFLVKVPGPSEEQEGLTKYEHAGDITQASLSALIKDYEDGKLKPHVKSEPRPAQQPRGSKIVVGTTWDEIVNDSSKDVFIELYAPWCGHCKKLEPIWAKLGQEFEGVDSITIAKMDATANDTPPNVTVQGFPTLLLFNANDKKNPITFQGDRSAKALKKFLKEKASQPFSLSKKKQNAAL